MGFEWLFPCFTFHVENDANEEFLLGFRDHISEDTLKKCVAPRYRWHCREDGYWLRFVRDNLHEGCSIKASLGISKKETVST